MTDIDQLVEQAAKNIFEHDDFGKLIPGVEQKPRWVERGNSGAQMIARSIAETAFSETLIAEWRAQKAEIERKDWIIEQVREQASSWKSEAKTQSSTVQEIYQIVTDKTGEPGDWHGASPVREMKAEIEKLREDLSGMRTEGKRMRAEYNELTLVADEIQAARDAALERVGELEADANKWRALISSERIRIMGYTHDLKHIGLELWRKHRAKHPCEEFPQDECRAILEAYVSGETEAPARKALETD